MLGPTTANFNVFGEKFASSGCSDDKLRIVGEAPLPYKHNYNEINKMMTKEIVSIVMDESVEDLSKRVPDILLDRINPPCRLERVTGKKFDEIGLNVVLDVCHNTQALEGTLKKIVEGLEEDEDVMVVFGASKGKDISALLETMSVKS